MKKYLLVLSFLIFASCSNSDSSRLSVQSSDLVGTWDLQSANLNGEKVGSYYKIQFIKEGRVQYYYERGKSPERGDYFTEGNILTIIWDEFDSGLEVYKTEIQELTDTRLQMKTIIPDEGTLIEVYYRVY